MITLEELKIYLKIESDSVKIENQLNLAISNAIGFLEGYVGYSLELNAGKIAFFDGRGDYFELDESYINSISKIEYGEDEFDESLEEYSGAKKVYLDRGLLKTKETIGDYIKVTYSFGYDETTCPGDLKMALYEITAMSYKNMGEASMGDVKSETVDGDQIVFKDFTGKISDNAIIILNKYKRYGFSS